MERINLFRSREFGEVFTDTFAFIRQEYQLLLKLAFLVFLPLGLINGLIAYFFADSVMQQIGEYSIELMQYNSFGLMAIMLVFQVFVGVLTVSISYQFFKAYVESNNRFNLADIISDSFSHFWKIVGLSLLIFVFALVAGLALSLIMTVMALAGPFVMPIFMIALMVGMIYVGVRLSFMYQALVIENISPMEAISRSWELTKGKFWMIFGIIIVNVIIFLVGASIIAFLVALPFQAILSEENVFNLGLIETILNQVSVVITLLSGVAISIYYFSRVEEKDGVSLMKEINELNTEEPNA